MRQGRLAPEEESRQAVLFTAGALIRASGTFASLRGRAYPARPRQAARLSGPGPSLIL